MFARIGRGVRVARRVPHRRRPHGSCSRRRHALAVERYALPNLRALNFVINGLLEEGVAASSRIDAQAKSLGEWLRARVVEVPVDLLAQ